MKSVTELARSAAEVLAHVVRSFQDSDGVSADEYWKRPLYHPMAEGKYLQTLAVSQEAGWISMDWMQTQARAAARRLRAHAIAGEPNRMAWGLGFSYKGVPADEPYLITTAIVAAGLSELRCRVDHPDLADLHLKALNWIAEFIACRGSKRRSLPAFSPNQPIRVVNSGAYAASALLRAHALGQYEPTSAICRRASAILETVDASYRSDIGFPYADGVPVVDLLHQAYILNALLDAGRSADIEEQALTVVATLREGQRFLDTAKITDVATAIADQVKASQAVFLRVHGSIGLVLNHRPARLWSLGEVVVLCARLSQTGRYPEFWKLQSRRAAEQLLTSYHFAGDETPSLHRPAMHAAHGLAAWLKTTRIRPRFDHRPQATSAYL